MTAAVVELLRQREEVDMVEVAQDREDLKLCPLPQRMAVVLPVDAGPLLQDPATFSSCS